MERGWIKQWRKEQDSAIWDKPPLFYKVWRWILLNADREGNLRRSLRGIAHEVAWTENNAVRIPHARTLKNILEFLVENGMIAIRSRGAGNTQYQEISVCNWKTYQSAETQARNTNEIAGNTECTQARNTNTEGISSQETHFYVQGTQEAGNTECTQARNTECSQYKNVQEVVQEIQEKNRASVELVRTKPRARVATPMPTSHGSDKLSTNPITLSEEDLLPPASNFDEVACFQHYLAEKQKYHRTRFLDAEVRHAIRVLHGDPTIEPRLGTEEIKLILTNWMEFGRPLKPYQLFEEHSKLGVPNWEACLDFARRRNNHIGDAPSFVAQKKSGEEILARVRRKQEEKRRERERF